MMSSRIVWGENDQPQETLAPEEKPKKYVHPLDNPEFIVVVQEIAPEYIEKIKTATHQTIHENPNEMERWETQQIIERQRKGSFEDARVWVLRLLYEEMFSVNQHPGQEVTFKGSYGCTVGGLISHFLHFGSMNGESMLEMGRSHGTLPDNILDIEGYQSKVDAEKIISTLYFFYQEKIGAKSSGLGASHFIKKILNGEKPKAFEDINQYEYRLVRLLANLQDTLGIEKAYPELLKCLGWEKYPKDKRMLVDIIVGLWKKFGVQNGPIFGENQRFHSSQEKLAEGIKALLFVRTNPDLQFLFKYFSPEGFLYGEEYTGTTAKE